MTHNRVRRAAALLLLCGGLLSLMAQAGGAAAEGAKLVAGVPVDRQAYVVDAPQDPYADDDSTIHVGVTSTQEYARAFVHLALDYLPDDARVGAASITLGITQSAEASKNTVFQTYNINHTSPDVALKACALTQELAAGDAFDPAKPPAYDCTKGQSAGTRVTDAAGALIGWRFDLTPLLKAWSSGNNGAAILPASTSTTAWTVSFTSGRTLATATYRLPPLPPAGNEGPTKSRPTYYRIPRPAPVFVPPPAPLPAQTPVVVETMVPGPAVFVDQPKPRTWMWVLPVCLLFSSALMAFGRRRFAGRPMPLPARLRLDVLRRPRAYAVIAVVTVWALLFATYSLAVQLPKLTASGPPVRVTQTIVPGQNGTPLPGTTLTPGSPGYDVVARNNPGVTPGSEFSGPGTYRYIGSTRVFFPANGGPPAAQLWTGQEDVTGLDFVNKTINLCGHAALIYGKAFHIDESDIRVFWDYKNAHGGIKGWKVNIKTYDDGYDPGKAVQAATNCRKDGAFMILSGIGFDQIPAVRTWAESRKQLYLHHMVTTAGSEGLRYSFTSLPSEEAAGKMAGRLAVQKFAGKKIGIIWRQSPNWQSGRDAFLDVVKSCNCGITVTEHPVILQQHNYTQEISTMKNVENADVVFVWENALATTEILQQAMDQDYHPYWLLFPFNLELYTLQTAGFTDWNKMFGVAAWDAYNPGNQSGTYAAYADLLAEFEQQYAERDPAGPSNQFGNDLLFLAWQSYFGVADLLERCLPECTRNRMAGILLTLHAKLHPQFCDSDFTRLDGHHGGWTMNYFDVFLDPRDRHAAWKPITASSRCMPVK